MIMNDPIDRFETNWGVQPTSIALKNDWTTPIGATNIEMAGKDWSSEGDFGDGLNGLPGFSKSTGLFGLGEDIQYPTTNESSIFDTVHTIFDASTFLVWPIAIYALYKIITPKVKAKATQLKTRREQLGHEREIYKSRRKRVTEAYPIF